MVKFLLKAECSVFVLIFGLISCGPNHNSKDIYHAPSPFIVHEGAPGSRIDFHDFDSSADHKLKLYDQIDVSETDPVKTVVKSRCQSGSGSTQLEREFESDQFFLFQAVSPEILIQDLTQPPPTCGFEITVFNRAGSSHIFNLVNVIVTEQPETDVPIENKQAKTNSHVLRIKNKQTPRATIHYNHKEDVNMKVVCEDLSFATMVFNHIKNLADIDLRIFEMHPNKNVDLADKRPLQRCRALILRKQVPIAMSERFEVLLPRNSIAMMEEFKKFSPTASGAEIYMTEQPTVLADHWLFNPGKQTRYLKISKEAKTGLIKTFAQASRTLWTEHVLEVPWFKLQVQDGELAHKDKDADIYAIRPSGSIQIQTVIVHKIKPECANNPFVGAMGGKGAKIQGPQMPAVEEVDGNGQTIESIELQRIESEIGRQQYMGFKAYSRPNPIASCFY